MDLKKTKMKKLRKKKGRGESHTARTLPAKKGKGGVPVQTKTPTQMEGET